MTALRGLTWDHPRGVNALRAAARQHAERIAITWDTQPLEGFESTRISELATNYDLIVLDHPHLGEAIADDCLIPVEDLLGDALADLEAQSIGKSCESYRYSGKLWALPLDAAAQVQVVVPEMLDERPPPTSWDGVFELAADLPVALSLGGPHALLTFFSVCAGLDRASLTTTADAPVPEQLCLEALDLLARLNEACDKTLSDASPITLLEAMSEGAAACCPLIFGYVTYATSGALKFCDAPGFGSTLGGTGIALTRRCPNTPELAEHLRWLLDERTQTGFIPVNDGQPSARRAWYDRCVDQAAGGFYSGTRTTLEAAWVRPRFDGYVSFQLRASELLRGGLRDRMPATQLCAKLAALWRESLPPSGESR